MKIVWLSRHNLTKEQEKNLLELLGISNAQIDTLNLTWQASNNANADIKNNIAIWQELYDKYDVITGVFPPVAIEALFVLQSYFKKDVKILTPISEQPKQRIEGQNISFTHLRWADPFQTLNNSYKYKNIVEEYNKQIINNINDNNQQQITQITM